MLRSTATLIFILLGQKGIQGVEIKSGSRGARNGGLCQTQADCRNPALDCVPSASGGQWGTCMDLWDLRRECTSNADCMNGYACQPHPSFYRPYCKAAQPSSGNDDINCCNDRDCPLDPTGTYNYCGTKALDPTGVYCHLNCPGDNQCLQEQCVPVIDECQTNANCPLQTVTVNQNVYKVPQKCVRCPINKKKYCKHPKTTCYTDRNCPQGQTCCTKYEDQQECQPCLDESGGYGCLDPTGIYCVKPHEGSQGCKPCKTKPLDPTGVYDGCLDPTGIYCVLRNNTSPGQQCKICQDPKGVSGCLDPTGVYCLPRYIPGRGKRSIQNGLDQLTPVNKRQLDPTGIYRVCEAPIQLDQQYPNRMPPDNWHTPHQRSCGNGMTNY